MTHRFELKTTDARPMPSGVVRDTDEGKVNYLLVRDGPMLRRWAELLTKGVKERGKRNWMNGRTSEDLDRFKESAARHFEQWLNGELDEDHAAAVIFNINGAEYAKEQMLTTVEDSDAPAIRSGCFCLGYGGSVCSSCAA